MDELKQRLTSIEVDNVLATGFVEELICDNINSLFPQILSTERPDKFCSEIVEGRAGIIIDGIPVSFVVPGTLVQFLQAPEDYSRNWVISSAIRLLRFSVMVLSLILPAYYIAVTSFHLELMPYKLALAISASRKDVAFPSFFETLLMLVAFEILFEASLRIPRSIGQAISIVGTIIIGQSAVDSKMVSPAVVIIIAVTSTASFVMPNQDFSNALRLWRLFLAILAAFAGLYGLILGFILLVHHLTALESFGVPYLSPFVSGEGQQPLEDTFFRFPLAWQKFRPPNLRIQNKVRRGNSI